MKSLKQQYRHFIHTVSHSMLVVLTLQLLAASICISNTAYAEEHHTPSHCQPYLSQHHNMPDAMSLAPITKTEHDNVCSHCDGIEIAVVSSVDIEFPTLNSLIFITTNTHHVTSGYSFRSALQRAPTHTLSNPQPVFRTTSRIRI